MLPRHRHRATMLNGNRLRFHAVIVMMAPSSRSVGAPSSLALAARCITPLSALSLGHWYLNPGRPHGPWPWGVTRARCDESISKSKQSNHGNTKPNSEATAIDTSANRLLASPLRDRASPHSRGPGASASVREPSQALVARLRGRWFFLTPTFL